jgi:hypothetical protein
LNHIALSAKANGMAEIKWAELCELAFIDKYDRLCMIGVTTRFAVPSLPLLVRQIMIAARIDDVRPGDGFAVGISMTTPSGGVVVPNRNDGFDISVAGEYILITLRDVPLSQEGHYRFEVSINEQEPVALEVLVGLVSNGPALKTRETETDGVGFEQVSRPSGRDIN